MGTGPLSLIQCQSGVYYDFSCVHRDLIGRDELVGTFYLNLSHISGIGEEGKSMATVFAICS